VKQEEQHGYFQGEDKDDFAKKMFAHIEWY